ncbi:MAG: hypothetical protein ABIG92_03715 [Candidatus Omnitrophota bacterium]
MSNMMFFIVMLIAAVLQFTILRYINVLIILAVFVGLREDMWKSLLYGMLIGLVADIFSITDFGLNMFLYGAISTICNFARKHIYYKENILMDMVFTFTGAALFYLLYFIFTRNLHVSIFCTALLSSVASPLIFRLCEDNKEAADQSL